MEKRSENCLPFICFPCQDAVSRVRWLFDPLFALYLPYGMIYVASLEGEAKSRKTCGKWNKTETGQKHKQKAAGLPVAPKGPRATRKWNPSKKFESSNQISSICKISSEIGPVASPTSARLPERWQLITLSILSNSFHVPSLLRTSKNLIGNLRFLQGKVHPCQIVVRHRKLLKPRPAKFAHFCQYVGNGWDVFVSWIEGISSATPILFYSSHLYLSSPGVPIVPVSSYHFG
jgi:hypothetical protein